MNRHTTESLACRMRYGVWLKDHGVTEEDLKRYFGNQTGRWSLPRELHPSVFVADHAIEAIRKHKSGDTPFFLWASFQDPHDPHAVPSPYDDMFDPDKMEYLGVRDGEFKNRPPIYQQLYENGARGLAFNDRFGVPSCGPALANRGEHWRKDTAIHHGMVALMDEETGRIIQVLRESNLYENTLIIFTADHGDYLGNHGFRGKGLPAFEEVYNLPFIVKNPRQNNAGWRSEALIGSVDLAPSFLDAAGAAIPSEMQG
jgi:arylsulfatase A-like enzyme